MSTRKNDGVCPEDLKLESFVSATPVFVYRTYSPAVILVVFAYKGAGFSQYVYIFFFKTY